MLGTIQQLQSPLEGLFLSLLALIVIRYVTLRIVMANFSKEEALEVRKSINTGSKWVLWIIIGGFLIYLLLFSLTNVVPKTEIKSDIKEERASYFEKTSQDILEKDTVNKQ